VTIIWLLDSLWGDGQGNGARVDMKIIQGIVCSFSLIPFLSGLSLALNKEGCD
jgi:hypothetical protein